MECSKIQEELGFYLDEVLDEQSLERVEAHMSECDVCRKELSALRMLVEAAGEIEAIEPPTGLRESILHAARSKEQVAQPLAKASSRLSFGEWLGSYPSPRGIRWAAGAVAAGILALAIMIGAPQESPQMREASVRTKNHSQSPAPTAQSQPTKIAVAQSPTVQSVEQNQTVVGQTWQLRTARPLTHSKVRIRVAKPYVQVASKLVKKNAHPIAARIDSSAERKVVDRDAEIGHEAKPAETDNAEIAAVPQPIANTETESDQSVVVKVATAPVLNNDKIREWMQNARMQAEMRKSGNRGGGVSIVSARF
jgi:hypothetical protein